MASAVLSTRTEADGTLTVQTASCPVCGKPGEVRHVPAEGWARWANGQGEFIQTALPELTAGERELLISGTHSACFDSLFPPDEDGE